jgi:putative membrane protein
MSSGLLLVPALVFLLYVGAFYQPMDNAKDTLVLFVNLDGGELSQTVESAILSSGVYKFQTVSLDYAINEVNEARAWGALIIPAGFEEQLYSEAGAPLILLADDSHSYIISKSMQPTMMVLTSKINAQILHSALDSASSGMIAVSRQEEYSAQSLNSLYFASNQLQIAQSQILSSTKKLSDYQSELASSNLKLQSNLKTSVQASWALTDGAVKLRDGSNSLSSGLLSIKNGSSQILGANSQLSYVLSNAYATVDSMPNSSSKNQTLALLTTAKTIAQIQNSGLVSLESGASSAYLASRTLHSGLQTLGTKSGDLTNGLIRIRSAHLLSTNSISEMSLSTNTLSSAFDNIQTASEQIGSSTHMLASKSS